MDLNARKPDTLNQVQVLLANTQGQPLFLHLKLVGQVARQMAIRAGLHDDNLDLPGMAECAGYGHDLGKAVSWTQRYFKEQQPEESELAKPLHHEMSWAFLTEKFGVHRQNREITSAIYWHHSRPLDEDGEYIKVHSDVLSGLSPADNRIMENLAAQFNWSPGFRSDGGTSDAGEEVPSLFQPEGKLSVNSKANARAFAIRTCLISADRLVSSLDMASFMALAESRTQIPQLLDQIAGSLTGRPVALPKGYQADRFDLQRRCAEAAARHRTVVVRAPAGFGKTMVGILWSLKAGQRLLWVCPRNVVADAVYRKVVEELDALGIDVTVELHLTGKRQSARGDSQEFGADIVVTNIDTILAPMVNNRTADRLFTVLSSAMVLDEFHEFASDAPLFAAFVTLMRARHRLCGNVRTLLLSATPMCIHKLWDAAGNQTVMLPGEGTHYPPAHAGRYRITLQDQLPGKPVPGSLTVCNSVVMAQTIYKQAGLNLVVHSRFTDDDRHRIMHDLLAQFGKNGQGVPDGKRVVSALVVQAAMDVSFQHLYESVCSPESTLQRIGRCDRWGNLQGGLPTVTLLAPGSQKNETGAVNAVYDSTLQALWLEALRAAVRDQQDWGLSDLYNLYNRFYQRNETIILKFLHDNYNRGLERLADFCPVKSKGPTENDGERVRGGRSLRNVFGSYNFSVRRPDGSWLGPDDVMDEGPELRRRFVDVTILTRPAMMRRHLQGLADAGFRQFGRYLRRRKRLPDTPEKWLRMARNPETPLPDFTREYDSETGLHERSSGA